MQSRPVSFSRRMDAARRENQKKPPPGKKRVPRPERKPGRLNITGKRRGDRGAPPENPGAVSLAGEGDHRPGARTETPALCRPGERRGRGPARHERRAPVQAQAARSSLTVKRPVRRSDGTRSGLRRKTAPAAATKNGRRRPVPRFPRRVGGRERRRRTSARCAGGRTPGAPHEKLARRTSSGRLFRFRSGLRPNQTTPPQSVALPDLTRRRPVQVTPPPAVGGPAVRAGGPGRWPVAFWGGART